MEHKTAQGTYGDLARLAGFWLLLFVVEGILLVVAYMVGEPTVHGPPSPWPQRAVFAVMALLPLGLGAFTVGALREWRRSRARGHGQATDSTSSLTRR